MSRIKKALEKAKAQRMAAEDMKVPKARRAAVQTQAPTYFKTRVVEVPRKTLLRNRIVAIDEDNPATDYFKLLRTRVLHRTRPENKNTIQVSGFDPDEGKTLIAVNLAICMARDTRQTTLLVDLDFRKPTIHRLLGLNDNVQGLKSYFQGKVALEDLFINPGIEKLTILPAGGRVPNSTEVMGSPQMEELVQELKQRYSDRYIIFDTPGLNTCPDPLVFSSYVDAILLVARANYTTSDTVETAMELIPHEKLIGTVLNDATGLDSSSYYYYRPY